MSVSDSEIAISVKDLSKTFKLPLEQSSGIKQLVVNTLKRRRGYEIQQVLKDISFDIKKGEFFGIVGRNGSGKSTLLKLLAGIYTPNSGHVQVNGTLTPFIELGVGFNMELSGRENVFLNGALLGFSKLDMLGMYDEIVEFAELEKFMDQKLKNYSSGMQVRLAFSIAIRANTDILVLDEVLAVGDEAFQKKCFEYFSGLKSTTKTVILVTHDMSSVERYCSRAMLIEKGEISYIGNKSQVAYLYEDLFLQEEAKRYEEENSASFDTKIEKKDGLQTVEKIEITQNGKKATVIKSDEDFVLSFDIHSQENVKNVVLGFHAYNSQGVLAFSVNTEERKQLFELHKNETTRVSFAIDNIYTDDTYTLNMALVKKGTDGYLFHQVSMYKFSIKGTKYLKTSLTHPRCTIEIQDI
jgi:ABC-2 type transport system ATP-binding protein